MIRLSYLPPKDELGAYRTNYLQDYVNLPRLKKAIADFLISINIVPDSVVFSGYPSLNRHKEEYEEPDSADKLDHSRDEFASGVFMNSEGYAEYFFNCFNELGTGDSADPLFYTEDDGALGIYDKHLLSKLTGDPLKYMNNIYSCVVDPDDLEKTKIAEFYLPDETINPKETNSNSALYWY